MKENVSWSLMFSLAGITKQLPYAWLIVQQRLFHMVYLLYRNLVSSSHWMWYRAEILKSKDWPTPGCIYCVFALHLTIWLRAQTLKVALSLCFSHSGLQQLHSVYSKRVAFYVLKYTGRFFVVLYVWQNSGFDWVLVTLWSIIPVTFNIN